MAVSASNEVGSEVRGSVDQVAKVVTEQGPEGFAAVSNWPLVVLTLMSIVGLIFLLAWFAKRLGGMPFAAQRQMKVVSVLPMGTRERIALIDVNGKQILVGITAQTINTLHSFDSPIITGSDLSAKPESDFASKLKSILNASAQNVSGKVQTEQEVKRDQR